MKCIFTIDVEEWFHILNIQNAPTLEDWDSLPSYIEPNFNFLLDILQENKIKVTCFFLGWIAERYPGLVSKAHDQGHEIASHGYSHELVYNMNEQEFFNDISRSKRILEGITRTPVLGYRSAGFSHTTKTSWFFDTVMEAGYKYDSSLFPAPKAHVGMFGIDYSPFTIIKDSHELIEFPITVTRILGFPLCFFGGGYLRLFPYFMVKKMAHQVLSENRPVIFYIHPREINPSCPRLKMNAWRKFKSYINLKKTESKMRKLLNDFEFTTFEKYIAEEYQAPEN